MSVSILNSQNTIVPQQKQLGMITYAKSEQIWSYAGKMLSITRSLLTAAAVSTRVVSQLGADFPAKVKNIVTHLKLFSICSVPFNLVDMKTTCEKIGKSSAINDKEGIAMGALSFTVLVTDTFDSITTFVNSVLATLTSCPMQIFSSLGLPAAFVMTSLGSIARTIQIAKASHLYCKINPEIASEGKFNTKSELKASLKETLGLEGKKKLRPDQRSQLALDNIKEKKKAVISRMIPKDATQAFENVYKTLKTNKTAPMTDSDRSILSEGLKTIRSHLQKKIGIEGVGLLANLAVISGLVLLTLGITTPLPFILMAIAGIAKLATHIYQEYSKA